MPAVSFPGAPAVSYLGNRPRGRDRPAETSGRAVTNYSYSRFAGASGGCGPPAGLRAAVGEAFAFS